MGAGAAASRRRALARRGATRGFRKHGRARRTAGPGCSPRPAAAEERRKEWVKERAGPARHRAGPQPRLDRLLHVHQGARRAGRRGARRARAGARSSARASSSPPSSSPYPGWIEGFKMAEPLILAYGRGELPEFPAAADTIVDIVPGRPRGGGDHRGAAPTRRSRASRRTSTCPRAPATRSRSATLYRHVREYFDEHPFESRRPRRGPAARLAVPRRAGRRAAARDERARPQGRRLRRSAMHPRPTGPRPGPQARPAGPAAGVPAPLPRPLQASTPRPSCASPTTARWRCSIASSRATRRRSRSTPRSSTGGTTSQEVHCPAVTEPIRKLDERAPRRRQAPKPGSVTRSRRPASGWRRSSTWTARCSRPTSSRPTCGCGCRSCGRRADRPRSAGSRARLPG